MVVLQVPGILPVGMTNEEMHAAVLMHRFGLTAEQRDRLAEVLMITANRVTQAQRGFALKGL